MDNRFITKVSTGIRGLDNLLFGGLQLMPSVKSHGGKGKQEGIIIALRGARGVHKTYMAMQLLHGLTKNLCCEKDMPVNSRFYSINKQHENLQNMLLDYMIGNILEKMIVDGNFRGNEYGRFLFNIDNSQNADENSCCDIRRQPLIPDDIKKEIDKYIVDGSVYYNTRTNALHFRRYAPGNDEHNLLYFRKYDSVSEYCRMIGQIKSEKGKCLKYIEDEIFDIDINKNIEEHENECVSNEYFVGGNIQKVINIVRDIEKLDAVAPCIVIDGFSGLSNDDLSKIEIGHIENVLREKARVSIMVFDDRLSSIESNADVIIDMRGRTSEQEDYTYHELKVSKSVFQESALGWHQYKKKYAGIEVYPSIHKLLHERHFYTNSRRLHGLLDINYFQYLGIIKQQYAGDEEALKSKIPYDVYENSKLSLEQERLNKLVQCGTEDAEAKCQKTYYLKKMLFPEIPGSLSPVTAFVGNPNTYKGYLVNVKNLYYSLRGYNSLAILLDRDEYVLQSYFRCPFDKDVCGGVCSNCYKRIHLYTLRMGCISADEFFYYLDERLERLGERNRISRIVMDNLHNIDYCFPFMRSENLFIPALINFCHERNIQLDIICDKKSSATQGLCLLADNVVCLERNKHELNQVTMLLEKSMMNDCSRKMYSVTVKNMSGLFNVSGREIYFNDPENNLVFEEIGSTKDFWRQKYYIHTH